MASTLTHKEPPSEAELRGSCETITSCDRAVLLAEYILARADIEKPRVDAQLLLSHAMGVSRSQIVARTVSAPTLEQRSEFSRLLRRRAQRTPLAYLRGTQEFYGLEFMVTPATLIPRPETEMLVEFALSVLAVPNRYSQQVLVDVGTGSGCIAIAVLKHAPQARAIAIDLSSSALEVARANAERHGVSERIRFVSGSVLDAIGCAADVLVSNPPYIPALEIDGLQPEVRNYEPRMALDGGCSGLDFFHNIAANALRVLKPGGWMAVECGQGQASAVADMLRDLDMIDVLIKADLAGIDRIVSAMRSHFEPDTIFY